LAFQYWGVPGTANRDLAQEGRTLLEQNVVAARQALGPEHPVTLRAALMLGLHYRNAGDLKLAEDIIPQTVLLVTKRAATHGDVLESLRMDAKNFLLWLRQRQGRHAEAKQLGAALWAEKQANTPVEGGKRQYDTRAANILWDHSYYTWWWDRDFQKAEQLLELALDISQERVGDAYPTGRLMYELSRLKLAQGRFDEVIELGRRGVALVETARGPTHHWTRQNGRILVGDIARSGRWDAVAAEFESQRQRGMVDLQSLAYEMLTAYCCFGRRPRNFRVTTHFRWHTRERRAPFWLCLLPGRMASCCSTLPRLRLPKSMKLRLAIYWRACLLTVVVGRPRHRRHWPWPGPM